MKPSLPRVVVSRCDRIGDLVLSLPALALLRDAGFAMRTLHCAPYCLDVARWAQHNGLCDQIQLAGHETPISPDAVGLALFHSQATVAAFRQWKIARRSWGPRAKLSALWSYRHTVAQRRSRVEKSEMAYNLDLAAHLIRAHGVTVPEFRGVPALALPPEFQSPRPSPHTVLNVSNRGSALNWPLERYVDLARERIAQGERVDFLVSGLDAAARSAQLRALKDNDPGIDAGIVEDFASLAELIAYLAGAREVISSSTGPLHLAHAAGVSVLGVFPARRGRYRVQSFDRWRPDGYWHAGALRYVEINP